MRHNHGTHALSVPCQLNLTPVLIFISLRKLVKIVSLIMRPLDVNLYASVKRNANARFLAKTSVYKSAWIVREYKKRGGMYDSHLLPPRSTGLQRWFREKWVDVSRNDHAPCGRPSSKSKLAYPLCRPTVRVTKNTPTTLQELSTMQIRRALKHKKDVKSRGRVRFQ